MLKGTFTALITPMNKNSSIDFGALKDLVEKQILSGISGLVPCGTTGESATMSIEERTSVIKAVAQQVDNRVIVIAGTGGNNTSVSIEYQKRAKDSGASHTLVVTPYYNKPSTKGLYLHYSKLLESVDIPIILYNVPSRTGCDMSVRTVSELSKLNNIVGIKEATGDVSRVLAIRECVDNDFILLSGDDITALDFVFLGGNGVISVTSNLLPKKMTQLINAGIDKNIDTALRLNKYLRPLFKALFWESNPIPIKAALSFTDQIQEYYRLPLCKMDNVLHDKLKKLVETYFTD